MLSWALSLKIAVSIFFKFYLVYVCLSMHACVLRCVHGAHVYTYTLACTCMPQCKHGYHNNTSADLFFPSSLWYLGIIVRPSGITTGAFSDAEPSLPSEDSHFIYLNAFIHRHMITFHFFDPDFISNLQYSLYKSFISLIKFIPKFLLSLRNS